MAASLIQQGHSGRFKAGRLLVAGQIVARDEMIAGNYAHLLPDLPQYIISFDTRARR